MSATAFPVALPAGSNGTSTITLIGVNGFSGSVSLFAVIAPSPTGYLTAILSPANVTLTGGSATSQLIITTTINTPPGFYTITLTGYGPTISQSISMSVQVLGSRDFNLAASPSFLDIPQGSIGTSQVTVSSFNGFTGTVSLAASFPLSGPTPSLSVNTISLTPGGMATSTLTMTTTASTNPGFYNITVTATNGPLIHSVSVVVQVSGPPDQPPVASFTFTPASPVVGQTVTFEGSSSRDPDGFVTSWSWNFGDNSFTGFGSFTSHQYSVPGNYSVTLTVGDNAGLTGTVSKIVQVRPQPQHDVSIVSINVYQRIAVSTQSVSIQVQLENDGASNETVTLTGYYSGHVIQTINGIFLQACPTSSTLPRFCYPYFYTNILWDTTGVQAGNYTISATVFLPKGEVDPTPADNNATCGIITILPPPVLTVTPTSGPIGTKVLVQGSGFPVPQPSQFGGPVGYIDVSFDDMFLGFTITQNGSFNFTLDVPQAQTGPHLVKAVDQFAGARGSASFTVTPTLNGNLAITIATGTVYLPGDNAIVYILTSLNGSPSDILNGQFQISLFKPDGTNITLSAISIGTGFYKATYNIPITGPLGTYAIVAKVHQTGPLDATALRSFEVKPTGVSATGPATGTSLAITLDVGTVYFPGDKATIFILTSQNGFPTSPSDLQLTVEVIKPDGSTQKLTTTKIAAGVYTSTMTLASANSIGTYSVIVTAHSSIQGEASSLRSFEVKPTWLNSNAPMIAAGLALVGLTGMVGVAWRKGYFRKDHNLPFD